MVNPIEVFCWAGYADAVTHCQSLGLCPIVLLSALSRRSDCWWKTTAASRTDGILTQRQLSSMGRQIPGPDTKSLCHMKGKAEWKPKKTLRGKKEDSQRLFTVKDRTKGLHSESVLIKVCLQLTLTNEQREEDSRLFASTSLRPLSHPD